MHSKLKEYENNSVNLVMAKYNDIPDSTNHSHSNTLSLIRFHIVKRTAYVIKWKCQDSK